MILEATNDTFIDGCLRIRQPRRGYRFSIDAVILAASVSPGNGETVLDLGTGCGIMPLILVYRNPDVRVIGVELQADLAECARINVTANQMDKRIAIVHKDLRTLKSGAISPADWIISNPPYRTTHSGRINPDSQKALARHEINLTLKELMQSTRRLLRPGGRFMTVYAAERTVDLLTEMRAAGIEPKWLQNVHSYLAEPAKLVLVRGVRAARPGGLISAQPLIIYNPDGSYTDIVNAMMRLGQ